MAPTFRSELSLYLAEVTYAGQGLAEQGTTAMEELDVDFLL